MINIKLLGTSIMIVFGVDGHGQCMTQSAIACEVLKKLGYKAKLVGGYHAMNYRAIDTDYCLVHAPFDEIPFDTDEVTHSNIVHEKNRKWYHCWVESGDKIIDVNLHNITHKKYTNIKKWDHKHLLKGKQYYMPTDYDVFNDEISDKKINDVIVTYNHLLNSIPLVANTEEGPIQIRKDGSWVPLSGYKINENILPQSHVFAMNPNILKDLNDNINI